MKNKSLYKTTIVLGGIALLAISGLAKAGNSGTWKLKNIDSKTYHVKWDCFDEAYQRTSHNKVVNNYDHAPIKPGETIVLKGYMCNIAVAEFGYRVSPMAISDPNQTWVIKNDKVHKEGEI